MSASRTRIDRKLRDFRKLAPAVVFLSLLLPVILIAVISFLRTERELTNSILSRKQSIARLYALTLQERFDRLVDIGVSLAARFPLSDLANEGRWNEAIALTGNVPNEFPFIERVFLTNTKGTLMADNPRMRDAVGNNFAYRDWFKGVSKGWKPYVSEVYKRHVYPQYTVVTVAVPVWNKSKHVVGVLALQVRLDTLLHWLKINQEDGEKGQIYFIDKSGHVVSHSIASSSGYVSDFSPLSFLSGMMKEEGGKMIVLDPYERKKMAAAYAVLKRYGWGVVIYEPLESAFVVRNTQLRLLLIVYGLIIAVTAFLTYVVLRSINARQRVAEALRTAHDTLELRVEERTQELEKANKSLEMEIVERKKMEAALKQSEERYELAVTGANDGIWDWDLKKDEIYFSPRWKTMLGYSNEEIGSKPSEWFDRIHPEDLERVKSEISWHIEGVSRHFQNEHRIRHKDGTYRWMLVRGVAVRNNEGKAYRIAGSQTDINYRKRTEEQLLHDAFHDGLTGLPNKALLMDRVGRALGRAKRRGDFLYALLFVEVDRFRVLNDSLGHTIGDQLLVSLSKRLAASIRHQDTLARLGGDEFVVLLDDIEGIGDATRIVNRINESLLVPFNLVEREIYITVSIGVVLSDPNYDRSDDILRDAEVAMYRAKSQGKGRHEIFDPKMHSRAMGYLEIETGLRRAMERDEFQLHYQPIISLNGDMGKIVGVEALIRWQHPDRGLIPPAEFIPIAEETGLILQVGEWVLRAACAQKKLWQEKGYGFLTVAINLSPRQLLSQRNFKTLISQVILENKIDPKRLGLEITESVFAGNLEDVSLALKEVSSLGVEVFIDDFGTGYSSLTYLKRFAIQALKIDQSFIRDITTDPDDAAIVSTIIDLAHSLKMKVIAEGVETKEQLAFLRAHKCDEMQGYLASKPVLTEIITEMLERKVIFTFPEMSHVRLGKKP